MAQFLANPNNQGGVTIALGMFWPSSIHRCDSLFGQIAPSGSICARSQGATASASSLCYINAGSTFRSNTVSCASRAKLNTHAAGQRQELFLWSCFPGQYSDHKFDGVQALPLELVCMAVDSKQWPQPSPKLLLLLMNEVPPLHFASAHAWISMRWTTIQCLFSIYPNMQFHDGKLPFHHLCHAGVPCCLLEWWLEECPDAISSPTMDTSNYPLHCYLSSSLTTTSTDMELLSTLQTSYSSMVIYLAEQYPVAMHSTNCMGWLPLHIAACMMHP